MNIWTILFNHFECLLVVHVLDELPLEGETWLNFYLLFLSDPLHELIGDLLTSDLHLHQSLLQSIAVVHRCSSCPFMTAIEYNGGRSAASEGS